MDFRAACERSRSDLRWLIMESTTDRFGNKADFKHFLSSNKWINGDVNRMLEDLLRACNLDFGGSWESYLHLVEFSYNNNSRAIIGMAPYVALYGRPCKLPGCCVETGDLLVLGTDII